MNLDAAVQKGKELFATYRGQQKSARAQQKADWIRAAAEAVLRGAHGSFEATREAVAQMLTGEASGTHFQTVHRKLQSVEPADFESVQDHAALAEYLATPAEEADGE
ncbi:MAG: hypothetical protein IT349_07915 [Candidatus Eisenbacteria bacterium]|nr:hypothetical protein [Candidatus Eisenbacteria bacterium]